MLFHDQINWPMTRLRKLLSQSDWQDPDDYLSLSARKTVIDAHLARINERLENEVAAIRRSHLTEDDEAVLKALRSRKSFRKLTDREKDALRNEDSARKAEGEHRLRTARAGKGAYVLLTEVDSLFQKLVWEFESAVIHGDADWFRCQADAIERKSGDTPRGRFNAKVSTLLLQAAISNANGNRVTASDIYEVLNKEDSSPRVLVEGLLFENRNRCIQEIRDLGTLIGLPLPGEQGKHPKIKRARIAPTLNRRRVRSAAERLRKTLPTD